jgi:hypothetical protein
VANRIIPLCRRVCPTIRHIFLYSQHIDVAVDYVWRMMQSRLIVRTVYEYQQNGGGVYIYDMFLRHSHIETKDMCRIRPQTMWEYAAITLGITYMYYLHELQVTPIVYNSSKIVTHAG